jgi:formate dehydrogenase beta subunit
VEDIPADSIIFAIGQTSDLSFLDPADGVESERGLIKVNRETYQTTAPDVFACGDIAHGARLFIDAIAARRSRRAPCTIFCAARAPKSPCASTGRPPPTPWRRAGTCCARESAVARKRERAASLEIVEEDYSEEEARRQASRCLRCNVNTVFDTSICVACNGCVDVCPENLIRLVGLSK